jgi:voltage-gated potassium channel
MSEAEAIHPHVPRLTVKRLVECNDSRAGRYFDLGIQVLILVSIVGFSLETLPGLPPTATRALKLIEAATVLVFTVEYLLRLWVADNRLRYVFSFFGLIDLLAILPFYIATAVDLRAIRIVRFMRLFRILKLGRYSRAIQRFRRAFRHVREELVIFAVATMFLLYLAAVGIYHFERDAQPEHFGSVFHSLWWAVATLSTVGYGDVYPITVGGRLFTGVLLLLGVGVVAIPSGLLASALTTVKAEEDPAGDSTSDVNGELR